MTFLFFVLIQLCCVHVCSIILLLYFSVNMNELNFFLGVKFELILGHLILTMEETNVLSSSEDALEARYCIVHGP